MITDILIISAVTGISIILLIKIIYYHKISQHLFKIIIEDLKSECSNINVNVPKRLFTLDFNKNKIIYKGIILGITIIEIDNKNYYVLFVKDTPFYLLIFDFFIEIFYKKRTLYIIKKDDKIISDYNKIFISQEYYNKCVINEYNTIYYEEKNEEVIKNLIENKSYKVFATDYAPVTQYIRRKPKTFSGVSIEKNDIRLP